MSVTDVVRVTISGPSVLMAIANAYDEPFVTCSPRLSRRFLDILSAEWAVARGEPAVRTSGAVTQSLETFFQEFPPRDGADFDTSDPAISYALVHVVRGRAYSWNVGGHYVRHARGNAFIAEVANDIRTLRDVNGSPFRVVRRLARGREPHPDAHRALWTLAPRDSVTVCSLHCPHNPAPHDVPASDAEVLRLVHSVGAPYIASCSWDEPEASA